eukprot:627878-Alexandrium_andersonii.AAC.1
MSASLVGSEMCIRDRDIGGDAESVVPQATHSSAGGRRAGQRRRYWRPAQAPRPSAGLMLVAGDAEIGHGV